jgi:exopolyphosphatase/guanosine-5'-triphosphate,3'-diphosphate pyrophosphatase
MRSAAVDVGSNTLRLLIADVHDNVLSRIYTGRTITRLAGGMRDSGRLREDNMRKSISVLKTFADFMAEYGVARVKAVGTSALREAKNSGEFVERAFHETGIRIEVIPATREAELTAKGILLGFKETDGSLMIDIGGGSTEWIFYGGEVVRKPPVYGSLLIGVVTLLERFMTTDPPSSHEIISFQDEIDSHLLSLKHKISERSLSVTDFIGTGGTITTLAAIDLGLKEYDHKRVHMHRISLERLSHLKNMLLLLPLGRRKDISGLEKERADLIIPGILLTIRFMEIFGFSVITVSDYGLLEGLLKETNDENGF